MDFFDINQFYYIIRMVVAGICGMLIGLERKIRSKEAGARTHCVVACASALMMIISKYGFSDMAIGEVGIRGADGARIAAQVVSGIGFLGAGMIFVHRNTITGLTTAAGIWATSGVGLAIGAGMYVVGIAASALVVLIQIILHKNLKILKLSTEDTISVVVTNTPQSIEYIRNIFSEFNIIILSMQCAKKPDNKIELEFKVNMPASIDYDKILNIFVKDSDVELINI